MKAYVLNQFGGPEVLKLQEVSEPKPAPDEVKIRVQAIGLNYAEVLSRKGQYRWAPKRPYIPGMEAIGEIVETGKNVMRWKPGDRVITGAQHGAYAEYHCTREYLAFPLFPDFSDSENAAFLVNFMTAWVALSRLARVRAGEKALIQSAAGGVGTAAVKLAKAMGCKVYGTAGSDKKLELLREMGVDLAINYQEEAFDEALRQAGVRGVDFVLELVGGEIFRKSVEMLNPYGRMVVAGYASIPFKRWNPVSWYQTWKQAPKVNLLQMSKQSMGIFSTHIGYLTDREDVATETWQELADFVKKNQLRPVVGHEFAFESMSEAHELMQSRRSTGKIIVKISQNV